MPVALFAFRLEGGYFAIGTWVIAEVFRLVILQIDSIGAGNVQSFTVGKTWDGYSLETRNDLIYWVALALGVGATLLSFLIVRSRLGLALQATRDSAGGAKALGVNVWLTKMIVWVLVAGMDRDDRRADPPQLVDRHRQGRVQRRQLDGAGDLHGGDRRRRQHERPTDRRR